MDRTQHDRSGRGVLARVFLPLWLCIGLALVLFATPTPAAACSSTLEAPALAHRDGAVPSIALEVKCESEDDDSSDAPRVASASPLISARVLEPRRGPVTDNRPPLVSNGLGRGPPQ